VLARSQRGDVSGLHALVIADLHLVNPRSLSQPVPCLSEHGISISSLAFTADGAWLISTSLYSSVRAWKP
jgi:hypothetical protein